MSTLWLVCDVSGSMLETGKRLIVRGLVREVEQYIRLDYGIKTDLMLVAWNDEARGLAWSPGEEIPADLFECHGSANGQALVQLLESAKDDRFIVFTDGFWPDESRVAVKRWKDALRYDAIRIFKIGADANPKLAGSDVFEAEEFLAAMDGWLSK